MALEEWMPYLVAHLAEISGLAAVGDQPHRVRYYEDLPGAIQEFPTLVITTVSGREGWGAGNGSIGVHQLQLTLFMTQQFLPEAHAQLIPYVALVRNKLAAGNTLGGRVASINPSEEADFYAGPGGVKWGGNDKEHGALIFRIQVKDHDAISVTP